MKKYIKTLLLPFLFKKETRARGDARFQRIYYNHIRKCGGTSINIAMIKSIGGNDNTYAELAKHKLHKKNFQPGSIVGWNTFAINRSSFFTHSATSHFIDSLLTIQLLPFAF